MQNKSVVGIIATVVPLSVVLIAGLVLLVRALGPQPAQGPKKVPPPTTRAEIQSRLEKMGYQLETASDGLDHRSIYSRHWQTGLLTAELEWQPDDRLESATFEARLAGADFDSPLGFHILAVLSADIDQVLGCKEDVAQAFIVAGKQADGVPRNVGTVTTASGWEVNAVEYLTFQTKATEPTELRYRVSIKRLH